MSAVIIGDAVPNMPWQERDEALAQAPQGGAVGVSATAVPSANVQPVWRFNRNPIIGRNPVPGIARIFNSAVIPYEGKFIGVFRAEAINGVPHIYLGRSDDGITWNFEPERIVFVDEQGKEFMPIYAYDPRLVKVEDTYYLMWCQDFYGAAIGMAKTQALPTQGQWQVHDALASIGQWPHPIW